MPFILSGMNGSSQRKLPSKKAVSAVFTLTVICLLLGIILRVYDLGHRSIWADEAWVALKTTQPHIGDVLFDESEKHYSYPPMFGVTVHLFSRVFGSGEFGLRFFPALCGIGALILIALLGVRGAGPVGAFAATALFGFSTWAVFYSRELKQYSADMFFALALILAAERLLEKRSAGRWATLAAFCIFGIWFSQTLLFIIPGALLVLGVAMLREKSWRDLGIACGIGAATLASFAVNYLFFITKQRHAGLPEYWAEFMADTGSAGALVNWSARQTYGLFAYLFTPEGMWFALFMFVAGVFFWAKRRPRYLVFCLLPLLLVWGAAAVGHYPYGGSRVLLFLLPLLILPIANSAQVFYSQLKKPLRITFSLIFIVMILIWARPAANGVFNSQFKIEESRPVIQKLEASIKPGDRIYVYAFGKDVFDYYYKGDRTKVTYGTAYRDNPLGYFQELDEYLVDGGQVWFFMTHFRAGKFNELEVFVKYLQERCKILAGLQEVDAAAVYADCPKSITELKSATVIDKSVESIKKDASSSVED